MKIILLTNGLKTNNGWGSYSHGLVTEFKKIGHEVVVICHEKDESIEVVQLPILPHPLRFKLLYPLSFIILFRILLHAKSIRNAEVVHSLIEPYSWIGFCISKLFTSRFFVTIHGSFLIKILENPFSGFLQKYSYKKADKIICVSSYTQKIAEGRARLPRTHVISNGIDQNQLVNKPKKLSGKRRIISIGGIKYRKGYLEALKAISILVKKYENINYIAIGNVDDVEYKKQIDGFISKEKLKENVIFTGLISEERKKKFLLESDIFLLLPMQTSFDFEGFGLVYLEANACGLPTIGSKDSGAADAIKEGYSGFLVDPKNPPEVADKISNLLDDPRLYDTVSKNALEWANSSIWAQKAKEYINIYLG